MEVDPATLAPAEAYRLLIACVVPRPVAWVSTLGSDGKANLAPFSFFAGVTGTPPTVMVSVGWSRSRRKDTATNLLASREAVVHVASRPLAEAMVATSARTPPGSDDFVLAGLTKAPATSVRPWRVAEAPVALETVLDRHLEVGTGPADVFFLEVVRVHVADHLLVDGLPDPARLAAVGRLGGEGYCDTSRPFWIQRPD